MKDLPERLDELYGYFVEFFWGIGFFGWHISTLYALFVSYNYSDVYFVTYIITFLLSGWVNHDVLKNYIHDPRPLDSKPFLSSEKFRKVTNGMPSGHAQQTAFSLTFAYLLSGKYLNESIALFLITVIQRFVFKNHTAPQLIVGSIIGVALGYAVIYLLKHYEKMNKPHEKDINAL